jgi:hypothetical protein
MKRIAWGTGSVSSVKAAVRDPEPMSAWDLIARPGTHNRLLAQPLRRNEDAFQSHGEIFGLNRIDRRALIPRQ